MAEASGRPSPRASALPRIPLRIYRKLTTAFQAGGIVENVKLLVVLTAVAAAVGVAVTAATGVTVPGRIRVEKAPIVAIAVTGPSVTYAVGDNSSKSDCAHVYFWQTAGGATGKWRFGKPTAEPCIENPSTGSGISAVAMSANRSLWIQYAGGNNRDWQLFTATRTKTKPRQLAFVERDVELPSPIVIGQGTPTAVPYAVNNAGNNVVTYLGDNGAPVFRWKTPAEVRLLAAGTGPNDAQVAAFLDSGALTLLSGAGSVVTTYTYSPAAVTAVALAPAGVVVQDGASVQIRNGAQVKTVPLPHGARMFGYGQGRIFYSLSGAIHALRVATNQDSLLVAARPGRSTVAAYAPAGGFAWSTGNQVNWDCAGCVSFGP